VHSKCLLGFQVNENAAFGMWKLRRLLGAGRVQTVFDFGGWRGFGGNWVGKTRGFLQVRCTTQYGIEVMCVFPGENALKCGMRSSEFGARGELTSSRIMHLLLHLHRSVTDHGKSFEGELSGGGGTTQ
jgi:hypothetical protein